MFVSSRDLSKDTETLNMYIGCEASQMSFLNCKGIKGCAVTRAESMFKARAGETGSVFTPTQVLSTSLEILSYGVKEAGSELQFYFLGV